MKKLIVLLTVFLTVFLTLSLILFIMYDLTNYNREENAGTNTEEYSMYLTPMFFPTSNGGIQMVMMPRIIEK